MGHYLIYQCCFIYAEPNIMPFIQVDVENLVRYAIEVNIHKLSWNEHRTILLSRKLQGSVIADEFEKLLLEAENKIVCAKYEKKLRDKVGGEPNLQDQTALSAEEILAFEAVKKDFHDAFGREYNIYIQNAGYLLYLQVLEFSLLDPDPSWDLTDAERSFLGTLRERMSHFTHLENSWRDCINQITGLKIELHRQEDDIRHVNENRALLISERKKEIEAEKSNLVLGNEQLNNELAVIRKAIVSTIALGLLAGAGLAGLAFLVTVPIVVLSFGLSCVTGLTLFSVFNKFGKNSDLQSKIKANQDSVEKLVKDHTNVEMEVGETILQLTENLSSIESELTGLENQKREMELNMDEFLACANSLTIAQFQTNDSHYDHASGTQHFFSQNSNPVVPGSDDNTNTNNMSNK